MCAGNGTTDCCRKDVKKSYSCCIIDLLLLAFFVVKLTFSLHRASSIQLYILISPSSVTRVVTPADFLAGNWSISRSQVEATQTVK